MVRVNHLPVKYAWKWPAVQGTAMHSCLVVLRRASVADHVVTSQVINTFHILRFLCKSDSSSEFASIVV